MAARRNVDIIKKYILKWGFPHSLPPALFVWLGGPSKMAARRNNDIIKI
jgi:hypothetical protein